MLESTYEGHNVYEIPVELGRSPKIPGSMRRIMLNDVLLGACQTQAGSYVGKGSLILVLNLEDPKEVPGIHFGYGTASL
jgi:hypothetical protein